MWLARWSFWLLRTIWLCIWMGRPLGKRCQLWAGSEGVINRLIGGECKWYFSDCRIQKAPAKSPWTVLSHDIGLRFLTASLILFMQVKEEPEVSDNCPSLLVYSYPSGTHETFYKVSVEVLNNERNISSWSRFWFFLVFTAPNSVRKSSMYIAWENSQSWSQWSMCPYLIVSKSKYPPL